MLVSHINAPMLETELPCTICSVSSSVPNDFKVPSS
jgi:hypothetical protein